MSEAPAEELALPPLREDLRIEAAAPLASGAPAWIIYDPARHRYFQIGQRVLELLSNWADGAGGALRRRLAVEKGWTPSESEVTNLVQFLYANELTAAPREGGSAAFAARADKTRRGALLGLAKAYLFFRVPLLRPERLLNAAAPFAAVFFSRGFAIVAMLAGIVGLMLASRQWDAFLTYAEQAISLDGAAFFAAALVLVKIVHELGHAFQATLRGVRVATMGVAFMVMMPLLYTDVSDAWRTKNRRDKLMIDAGGVLAELSLAAFATLAWVFLPDGPLRFAAFALATASWVLSLAVNLNPFMRFDGYYFLGDAIGVQNLQPRSFAICRWRIREILFGLGEEAPEKLSPAMRRFMVLYAVGTWIYRLFLFIGIALIVYNLFFKALGLLLFLVEIAFFIALPVMKEVAAWARRWKSIVRSPRALVTGGVFAGLALFFVIPMPVKVTAPATLSFEREAWIYPTAAGQVVTFDLEAGASVEAGGVIATFATPELDRRIAATRLRIALLELRLGRGAADVRERASAQVLSRELEGERARLAGLQAQVDLTTVRAPFAGVAVNVDRRVRPGLWVGGDARLGLVVDASTVKVRGYVSEDDLARVELGSRGVFIPDDPLRPKVTVQIEQIDGFAADRLYPGYLASTAGGPIAVATDAKSRAQRPSGSWFAISFDASQTQNEDASMQVQRGVVIMNGAAESWAQRFFTQIARIFVREIGA